MTAAAEDVYFYQHFVSAVLSSSLTKDGVRWTKLNRNLHHAQANTIHADTGLSVCLSVCALAVRAFPDTSLIEQSMDSQHSCISMSRPCCS